MDISSKFSAYDTLGMIIPGGVIMLMVVCCIGNHEPSLWTMIGLNLGEISYALVFVVGAYLLGLINNWLCDGIFRGFRNIPQVIERAYRREIKISGDVNLHNFVAPRETQEPDKCSPISVTLRNICKKVFSRQASPVELDLIVKSYYTAYYALAKHNRLGAVPMLEAQVALLRNMIIPTLFAGIVIVISNSTLWAVSLSCLAMTVLFFIVMVQRQSKVYNIVWSNVNYYKI